MNIRALKLEDIPEAKKIFDKFYKTDSNGSLEFPDMTKDYLCCFVVEDDNGKIISVGGVRTIAEVTLMTDKDISARKRVIALKEILRASGYIARNFRFDWLHAVTDDPTWANQLESQGFKSRGQELEIHVEDIK